MTKDEAMKQAKTLVTVLLTDDVISKQEAEILRQALEQPEREWVGLTDEEYASAWAQSKGDVLNRLVPFARAIEAKLKEKNIAS
jgi:intergrase/recombinase